MSDRTICLNSWAVTIIIGLWKGTSAIRMFLTQVATNVFDDFEETIKKLKNVASSLKVCDNPRLQSLGYRRINFQQHRYFMLYRIENDVVYVDDIFHELQDYENRMI